MIPKYDYQEEHRFVSTKDSPLSTFAADCDTASYSNIRSYIEEGTLPPAGAVRVEEMINYFDYDYVSDRRLGRSLQYIRNMRIVHGIKIQS